MRLTHLTESSGETLYHVTFDSRVAAILRDGIVGGKNRNWSTVYGTKYGDRGFVYLFTTEESAVRWAYKMNYEFKRDVSILVLNNVEASLIDDESGEAYLMTNGAGTWKRTQATIPPQCIAKIVKFNLDMARKLVAITSGKHDGSSLLESVQSPSDIVRAKREQWCDDQGLTPKEINNGQCFDFAEELERENRDMFEAEGFGNFMNHDYEAGEDFGDATGFDQKWLQHRPHWQPPEGLDWDDMFKIFSWDGTHGWAYCERDSKCYDIEHPEGVYNVFDLTFLQPHIADYRRENNK